jgi:ABC-type branched-subunit amino acid transport system ATPase component
MSAPLIEVSHLRKRYGEAVVVDDVSFTLRRANAWA